MNVLKAVLFILFFGLLLHIYIKYLPGWVEKFQEVVLEQPVKKEGAKSKENDDKSYNQSQDTVDKHKKDEDKKYQQKAEEEIEKILGIKKQKEEPKEESLIDKIKNYIKMLKSKLFQE